MRLTRKHAYRIFSIYHAAFPYPSITNITALSLRAIPDCALLPSNAATNKSLIDFLAYPPYVARQLTIGMHEKDYHAHLGVPHGVRARDPGCRHRRAPRIRSLTHAWLVRWQPDPSMHVLLGRLARCQPDPLSVSCELHWQQSNLLTDTLAECITSCMFLGRLARWPPLNNALFGAAHTLTPLRPTPARPAFWDRDLGYVALAINVLFGDAVKRNRASALAIRRLREW
ncbi:hypothetical protein A0H81_06568 [Grifola frondosa]|uniref:Uncharacterized protein n=1 Tax=Grifola frondosa TaxID=5627 RepID=A0A1C7M9X0_GRIFR|nr:hypothetical protein A0H81_06568 [Grifola frondosa]